MTIRSHVLGDIRRATGTLSRPGVEPSFTSEANLTIRPGATARLSAANVIRS